MNVFNRNQFLANVGCRLATDLAASGSFLRWELSSVEEGNSRGYLTREDGLTLYFSFDAYGNKGKIAISYSSGDLNKGAYVTVYDDKYQRVSYPSINVSMTKTPDQVARDIQKRLMTDAVRVHGLVLKSIADSNNFVACREATTIRLAALLGTEPKRDHYSKALTYEIDPYVKVKSFESDGYGEIKVSSGNSIDINLKSMSFETARKVVEALSKVLVPKA